MSGYQSDKNIKSIYDFKHNSLKDTIESLDHSFAVIGGDLRQIAMAESIAVDGYPVITSGLENAKIHSCVQKSNLNNAINQSKYVILPLPVTKDGKTLNAPFSNFTIEINKDFLNLLKNKTVFCGMLNSLLDIDQEYKSLNITDYSKRNEFCIQNAVATAEGAVEIAMQSFDATINGSKCLVAGFGRIGKALSNILKGLNANVSICARKKEDIAWIEAMGFNPINTNCIYKYNGFDLIFNTIPYMIFNAHTLAKTAIDSIVIDLASAPGGVDFEAAKRLDITAIQALSLPGKVAPKSAGQIIKSTIYNIIEEG